MSTPDVPNILDIIQGLISETSEEITNAAYIIWRPKNISSRPGIVIVPYDDFIYPDRRRQAVSYMMALAENSVVLGPFEGKTPREVLIKFLSWVEECRTNNVEFNATDKFVSRETMIRHVMEVLASQELAYKEAIEKADLDQDFMEAVTNLRKKMEGNAPPPVGFKPPSHIVVAVNMGPNPRFTPPTIDEPKSYGPD